MRFAHLGQRLFNTPLAIRQDKAEVIMAALAERLGVSQIMRLDGANMRPMAWDDYDDDMVKPGRRSGTPAMTWWAIPRLPASRCRARWCRSSDRFGPTRA